MHGHVSIHCDPEQIPSMRTDVCVQVHKRGEHASSFHINDGTLKSLLFGHTDVLDTTVGYHNIAASEGVMVYC